MELSPEIRSEIDLTLAALEDTVLPMDLWQRVTRLLRELDHALRASDEKGTRGALIPLAQIIFEAKVGGRSTKPRLGVSAVVIPTKSTPVLPLVGAICAAVLLLLAWMLGGGLILLATGVLSALVMIVAISGSQSRHFKPAREISAQKKTPTPEAAPPKILAILHTIRAKIKE